MKKLFFIFVTTCLCVSCVNDPQLPDFFYKAQGKKELQFSKELNATEHSRDTAVLQVIAPATMSLEDVLAKSQEENLCNCQGIKVEVLSMQPDSVVASGGKVSQQIISGPNGPETYWIIQIPAIKSERKKGV